MKKSQPEVMPGRRLPAVDGLRAVACLFVVAFHALTSWSPSLQPAVKWWGGSLSSLTEFIHYGFGGVDLFFVLSGFCLSLPMFANPNRPFRWGEYLKARAWRILPPYWASFVIWIGLTLLARALPQTNLPAEFSAGSLRPIIYGFLLIYLWGNVVYWTLVLEARWYFVLPLLWGIFRRFPGKRGVLLMLSLTIAISLAYRHFSDAHVNSRATLLISPLPLYLPEFGLGIAIAWLQATGFRGANGKRGFVGTLSLVGILFFLVYCVCLPPPIYATYSRIVPFGLLSGCALLAALYQDSVRRVLSVNWLVQIGEMSYSIYLIHLPVIQLIRAIMGHRMMSPNIQCLWSLLVVFPFSVVVGCGFFYLFERPVLAWRSRRRMAERRMVTS